MMLGLSVQLTPPVGASGTVPRVSAPPPDRLATLHDAADEKVFHSVIVITDRRVFINETALLTTKVNLGDRRAGGIHDDCDIKRLAGQGSCRFERRHHNNRCNRVQKRAGSIGKFWQRGRAGLQQSLERRRVGWVRRYSAVPTLGQKVRDFRRTKGNHALVCVCELLLDFINLSNAEAKQSRVALNQNFENALPPGKIKLDSDVFARGVQSRKLAL